jgi:hypothetical protein
VAWLSFASTLAKINSRTSRTSSLSLNHAAISRKALDCSRTARFSCDGEPQYDDLEQQLASSPTIGVPTITLEGDANGAPHADPSTYASKFTGKYQHRDLTGGIGHNLPQEAPQAFAQAIGGRRQLLIDPRRHQPSHPQRGTRIAAGPGRW